MARSSGGAARLSTRSAVVERLRYRRICDGGERTARIARRGPIGCHRRHRGRQELKPPPPPPPFRPPAPFTQRPAGAQPPVQFPAQPALPAVVERLVDGLVADVPVRPVRQSRRQEGAGDLGHGQTGDHARRQCQAGFDRQRRVTAGEDQPEPVVAVHQLSLFVLVVALVLPPDPGDRLAVGRGGQPGAGVGRYAVSRPPLDGGRQRLGDVEVTEPPGQGGDNPGPLLVVARCAPRNTFSPPSCWPVGSAGTRTTSCCSTTCAACRPHDRRGRSRRPRLVHATGPPVPAAGRRVSARGYAGQNESVPLDAILSTSCSAT
jgi:hypothetical protein